jgi:hypothetical protein
LSNEPFEFGEFMQADFAGVQEVAHHVGEAPRKQAVDKMIGHTAGDGFLANGRAVNEAASLAPVLDQAALLHLAEHGCDGGVSEVSFVLQLLVDVGDGRFAASPEQLHDAELKIAEAVDFGAAHKTDLIELPK